MTRRKKETLRRLTEEEQIWLERISRSQSEAAVHVIRAKELLAMAGGRNYAEAARLAGIKTGDTVSRLVNRFNQEGLQAIQPRHAGGAVVKYSAVERERVLTEARRQPDPEKDGTNTWSLTTLQRALQKAPEGLAQISTERIWVILQEAGFRWQKSHSCCETDHLGSTSITADADGEILSELRYSAFGEVRYSNNTTPTDRLYTGQREITSG